MRFGPVSLEECEGEILAHNVSDETGRRILRKGRRLDGPAVERLRTLGYETIFVAILEAGDVEENEAARRIAAVVAGVGVIAGPPHSGRVNLLASERGVVRVDVPFLLRLNEIEGITLATVRADVLADRNERIATVKVIPYAIPEEAVSQGEAGPEAGAVVSLDPIGGRSIAVVLVGSPGAQARLEEGIGGAIRRRIERLGCSVSEVVSVFPDEAGLSRVLLQQEALEPAMIIVAGETAIMDLDDVIPRGLRSAGGHVEGLGLPMDPGQLLLLGYLDGTPVVGAPGCVRGSTPDGFDAVVPRLLTGERLTRLDLLAMGHGGLLSDPRRA